MPKNKSRSARLRAEGMPILPTKRQQRDPTYQGSTRKSTLVDNAKRWRLIAKEINSAVDSFIKSTPQTVRTVNIAINKKIYNYDVDPISMAEMNKIIRDILDRYLSIDPDINIDPKFWMSLFVERAYESGTRELIQSLKNISTPETLGDEMSQEIRTTPLETLINDPQYIRRVELVKGRVFENMKGLSQSAKADLADTLARGMSEGKGIAEIKKNIISRIGVAKRRAETIARTEINNAYRTAKRKETDAVNERLFDESDYEMAMLWFSALAPTTREWHASRHGKTYTTEEVAQFYSVDGNAINCLCSQVAVLRNKKTGEVVQQEAVAQMKKQEKVWQQEQAKLENNSHRCKSGCVH